LGPGFSSACNTPFRRHKTWVHEGGIATPLLVSWPAKIKSKGELRTTPAHVVDFMPTVLDTLGIQKPTIPGVRSIPIAPGRSLVPSFSENVDLPRDSLWWLHGGNRALRQNDWKLVAAQGDPWELYDLATDRAENNNLAAQYPEIVQRLAAKWEGMAKEFTRVAQKPR
jgi:arylsulfatase